MDLSYVIMFRMVVIIFSSYSRSLDGSLFDDLPELLMQVEQAPELAEL